MCSPFKFDCLLQNNKFTYSNANMNQLYKVYLILCMFLSLTFNKTSDQKVKNIYYLCMFFFLII